MALSFISWNVNGSRNISDVPFARSYVLSHDLVFLQETFEVPSGRSFRPPGFLYFANEATATGGRPSGGLSILIRSACVGNGSLTRIISPTTWILALRWVEPGKNPTILINVYVARFTSGFTSDSVDMFRDFFTEVRCSYPGDSLLIAGDWNADVSRAPQGPIERDIMNLIAELEGENFERFPGAPTPTFADRGVTSMLDYVLVKGLEMKSGKVDSPRCCQHFPISACIFRPSSTTTIPQGR